MTASLIRKRVCLVVIDGWGISPSELIENQDIKLPSALLDYDAIRNAHAPLMHRLMKSKYSLPNSKDIPLFTDEENIVLTDLELKGKISTINLDAHGLAVGLPAGLMGNSEVGHLNLGAGRIVYQDIVRIDKSIQENTLMNNDVLQSSIAALFNRQGSRCHLIGLVSDGGVHSHQNHLYELLRIFKEASVSTRNKINPLFDTFVHFIADGRDTAPKSAKKYMNDLLDRIDVLSYGKVGTLMGRYYAMDRDKRWERTALAYDALTQGVGELIPRFVEACGKESIISFIQEKYDKNVETDEFFKPAIIDPECVIKDGDIVLFFNYRSDRMRQLVTKFIEKNSQLPDKVILEKGNQPQEGQDRNKLYSMTQYNHSFASMVQVLFPPQNLKNVLAEWLSTQNIRQCHIAETEKYAHVTFFFNGGVEKAYTGEDRVMVPSPRVATYDLQPSMSSDAVATAVISSLQARYQDSDNNHDLMNDIDKNRILQFSSPYQYDLVMCNLAPPDMVGHTGSYEATLVAVGSTDNAIRRILLECIRLGVYCLITADHGNAEKMLDPITNSPHTAHTTSPVPFILINPTDGQVRLCANLPTSLLANPGQAPSSNASLCDVAPTILQLLNLPIPEEMTGISLVTSL